MIHKNSHGPGNLPDLWRIVLLTLLPLSILISSIYAHKYPLFPGDLVILSHLQVFDSKILEQTMKVVTQLGDKWGAIVLVLAAAFVFVVKKHNIESLLLVAVGAFSLVGRELKLLVDRPRPSLDIVHVLDTEISSSFPSGHAIFALAFFGTLFYFLGIYIARPILRRTAQAGMVVLVLLIGMSRVYLGVHWPSDVVGGYLVGGLILTLIILFHKRLRSTGQ